MDLQQADTFNSSVCYSQEQYNIQNNENYSTLYCFTFYINKM